MCPRYLSYIQYESRWYLKGRRSDENPLLVVEITRDYIRVVKRQNPPTSSDHLEKLRHIIKHGKSNIQETRDKHGCVKAKSDHRHNI